MSMSDAVFNELLKEFKPAPYHLEQVSVDRAAWTRPFLEVGDASNMGGWSSVPVSVREEYADKLDLVLIELHVHLTIGSDPDWACQQAFRIMSRVGLAYGEHGYGDTEGQVFLAGLVTKQVRQLRGYERAEFSRWEGLYKGGFR